VEGVVGMNELLMDLIRAACLPLLAYSTAYFGAIGWHAGRVYAARKYGPYQTNIGGTATVVHRTGEPL